MKSKSLRISLLLTVSITIITALFSFLYFIPSVKATSTILTKRPNGDSSIQLVSYNGSATNAVCVDEASANDTDYVELSATATYRDLYTLDGGTIPAGTVVNSVTAFFRCIYYQVTSTATIQAA